MLYVKLHNCAAALLGSLTSWAAPLLVRSTTRCQACSRPFRRSMARGAYYGHSSIKSESSDGQKYQHFVDRLRALALGPCRHTNFKPFPLRACGQGYIRRRMSGPPQHPFLVEKDPSGKTILWERLFRASKPPRNDGQDDENRVEEGPVDGCCSWTRRAVVAGRRRWSRRTIRY